MKNRLPVLWLNFSFLLFFLLPIRALNAQLSGQKSTVLPSPIVQLLESKRYRFVAQTVVPSRGGNRNLTGGYDLTTKGDSLVSYLPFFGRAYSAPLGSGANGIMFTSTAYTQVITPRKKGWDVSLKPTDVTAIRQLVLTVSASGYATLQVLSNNRDPISFWGRVESIER